MLRAIMSFYLLSHKENEMTKAELLKELASRTNQTVAEVKKTYNALFEIQKEELLKGNKVDIPGLGKLFIKDVAARNGINLHTKEKIVIAARKALKFKAGSVIKSELKEQ